MFDQIIGTGWKVKYPCFMYVHSMRGITMICLAVFRYDFLVAYVSKESTKDAKELKGFQNGLNEAKWVKGELRSIFGYSYLRQNE